MVPVGSLADGCLHHNPPSHIRKQVNSLGTCAVKPRPEWIMDTERPSTGATLLRRDGGSLVGERVAWKVGSHASFAVSDPLRPGCSSGSVLQS